MKTENRQQLLIILTIVVAGLFAADKLIYTPLTNLWQARAKEIHELRVKVARGTALKRDEDGIRKNWEDMQANMLPNNPSQGQEEVLKALQDWAQESGASLNGITPQWKSGDSDDYKTLVCRVDASGTLWMLTRFIYDVEKGPLGLKLESVDLSSKDNTGQQLNLGLQVSGLVLTPQSK